jgi:uncharacterized protein YutD
MWQADLSIVIKTYSKYHIDVLITETDGRLWRFTGFYGESKRAQRKELWRLLWFCVIKMIYHGCAYEILMKLYTTMIKLEAMKGMNGAWRALEE